MSSGDHGYGGDQTRTRLPEGSAGDAYGSGRRPGGRPSRSLITVVGVVVLLVAAIAFANRGGGNGGNGGVDGNGGAPQARQTAPTGERPVTGSEAGIASGFPKTEQGAESAAANYAVALASADILKPDRRQELVEQLFVPSRAASLKTQFDKAYSKSFLDKLGLDENGDAEEGMTYVSRTAPVGTKVTDFGNDKSRVEVWCTGVFGTAGVGSTNPVVNDWFTMTLDLQWTNGDWKTVNFSQKDGPAPVNSDRKASDADEIAKAVEEYGGFTYAR
ncbi:hypothetical protein [Streptomyces lycii]|uniref:DUF8175 domain-containing protein n=1 Tax=Streptomyces lycii TaxID=2654337 RepID=A0ABQ7FAZ6_9ACTN|nr:hypothetical protein [Streptomyces lycii]KAF4405915.1 hypothetical protein GCU69_27785 [Streptomyces lycii]